MFFKRNKINKITAKEAKILTKQFFEEQEKKYNELQKKYIETLDANIAEVARKEGLNCISTLTTQDENFITLDFLKELKRKYEYRGFTVELREIMHLDRYYLKIEW